MNEAPPPGNGERRRRLIRFYVGLGLLVVVGFTISFALGDDRFAETSYSGRYEVSSDVACLGNSFDLRQSGQFAQLTIPDSSAGGSLRVDRGKMTGTVECVGSGEREVTLIGSANSLDGRLGERAFAAVQTAEVPPPEAHRSVRPTDVTGTYGLAPLSACLGSEISLDGPGDDLDLTGAGQVRGRATYEDGDLRGRVRCGDGTHAWISGEGADRSIQLDVRPDTKSGDKVEPERIEATETRDLSATVAAFLAALVVVMGTARLFGAVAVRLRQPRVMGEVVAGIALGPTILGAIAPEVGAAIFPSDLIVPLGVAANLGVVLYMFMIGVELDLSQLRSRVGQAAAISNASLAIPMVLGVAAAVPAYELVGPDVRFSGFALFMGVAMSITAFPVLARILAERGLLQRPIGALAMAAAAFDDVSAWFLIALATAFATAGSGGEVVLTIALAIAFSLLMIYAVRPLVTRAFASREGETRIPDGWLAAVLAGVLLAAFVTEAIGIAVIFGAFIAGLIMPSKSPMTQDATRRIEDVVVLLLLPLFFAYTGLRTNVGLLDDPALWLLAGALLLVAIVGKFGGAIAGARVSGLGWRDSVVIGTLMNTRGLTELIALNLALDLGVISEALFTALVLMALITTFMAGPLLNLLERRGRRDETDSAMPEPAKA